MFPRLLCSYFCFFENSNSNNPPFPSSRSSSNYRWYLSSIQVIRDPYEFNSSRKESGSNRTPTREKKGQSPKKFCIPRYGQRDKVRQNGFLSFKSFSYISFFVVAFLLFILNLFVIPLTTTSDKPEEIAQIGAVEKERGDFMDQRREMIEEDNYMRLLSTKKDQHNKRTKMLKDGLDVSLPSFSSPSTAPSSPSPAFSHSYINISI